MNNASTILVGRIGDVFWLRVEGRGTFQNSVQVKTCFQQVMAAGMRNFVVDLERCPMMDSTFLGTLTGAALNLTELGEGRLSLLNANPRNQHLITSLGLDHILELDTDGKSWVAPSLPRSRRRKPSWKRIRPWRASASKTAAAFTM